MGAFEDLTGQKFGKLTVMFRGDDYIYPNGKRRPQWVCQCDCGNVKNICASNLKRGTTTSCGCAQIEQLKQRVTKHGGWANKEKLYEVWHNMRRRCYCETDSHYPDYGRRGIAICDEWKNDYPAFRDWALSNGYREGLSIDRINVNGNYDPSNCRWTTNLVQQNNRRCTIKISYKGRTQSLTEWARELNIPYRTLYSRYRWGWDVERMLKKLSD